MDQLVVRRLELLHVVVNLLRAERLLLAWFNNISKGNGLAPWSVWQSAQLDNVSDPSELIGADE